MRRRVVSGLLILLLGAVQGFIARHVATTSEQNNVTSSGAPSTPLTPSSEDVTNLLAEGDTATVLEWLPNASKEDILRLLATWDSNSTPPHHTTRLWCLLHLAEQDPATAFRLASKHAERCPDYDGDLNAIDLIAKHIFSVHPGSSEHLLFAPNTDLADPAWLRLVKLQREHHLDRDALKNFQEAGAANHQLKEPAKRLLKVDPSALAHELTSLGPEHPGFFEVASELLSEWGRSHSKEASEWLQSISDKDMIKSLRTRLLFAMAGGEADPAIGAKRLLTSLPASHERTLYLFTFLIDWGLRDFEAALRWTEDHLKGEERGLALLHLCYHESPRQPYRVRSILSPYWNNNRIMREFSWPPRMSAVKCPDGSSVAPADRPWNHSIISFGRNDDPTYADMNFLHCARKDPGRFLQLLSGEGQSLASPSAFLSSLERHVESAFEDYGRRERQTAFDTILSTKGAPYLIYAIQGWSQSAPKDAWNYALHRAPNEHRTTLMVSSLMHYPPQDAEEAKKLLLKLASAPDSTYAYIDGWSSALPTRSDVGPALAKKLPPNQSLELFPLLNDYQNDQILRNVLTRVDLPTARSLVQKYHAILSPGTCQDFARRLAKEDIDEATNWGTALSDKNKRDAAMKGVANRLRDLGRYPEAWKLMRRLKVMDHQLVDVLARWAASDHAEALNAINHADLSLEQRERFEQAVGRYDR